MLDIAMTGDVFRDQPWPARPARQDEMERATSSGGQDVETRVRDAGLRPTRQRISLASLLFAKGDRHLTAEELHEEAQGAGVAVSLATVYNTLHQFTDAGMLRILAVEGSKTYFDTNTSDHHHFYVEGENKVLDIDAGPVTVGNVPEPPPGMEIANIDIVIRLRPKRG
jgi:Fur family transcriptional regulator, iron response regulator